MFHDTTPCLPNEKRFLESFLILQLDFNRKLQAQLEEAVQGAATPDEACVGDIFHNFGPYLKMYSAYVDKHADALKALDVAEESSASFRAFLTNIYALNTVRGQTLRSFLIMPGEICTAPPATPLTPMSHAPLIIVQCNVSRGIVSF